MKEPTWKYWDRRNAVVDLADPQNDNQADPVDHDIDILEEWVRSLIGDQNYENIYSRI